jgi:hypothetical protein
MALVPATHLQPDFFWLLPAKPPSASALPKPKPLLLGL